MHVQTCVHVSGLASSPRACFRFTWVVRTPVGTGIDVGCDELLLDWVETVRLLLAGVMPGTLR